MLSAYAYPAANQPGFHTQHDHLPRFQMEGSDNTCGLDPEARLLQNLASESPVERFPGIYFSAGPLPLAHKGPARARPPQKKASPSPLYQCPND